MTGARRARTVERMVAIQIVLYTARQLDAQGRVVEVGKVAARGDTVTLDARELARLESLGALAPSGWSIEQLDASDEAVHGAYVAARQAIVQGAEAY